MAPEFDAVVRALHKRARQRGFLLMYEVHQALEGLGVESFEVVFDRLVDGGVEIREETFESIVGVVPANDEIEESETFRAWLEVDRLPKLGADQELELLLQVAAGTRASARLEEIGDRGGPEKVHLERDVWLGKQAWKRLVEANVSLVLPIARQYADRGLEVLDLMQEGIIGLGRAIDDFDPHQGFTFSSYAAWRIRNSIDEARRDRRLM